MHGSEAQSTGQGCRVWESGRHSWSTHVYVYEAYSPPEAGGLLYGRLALPIWVAPSLEATSLGLPSCPPTGIRATVEEEEQPLGGLVDEMLAWGWEGALSWGRAPNEGRVKVGALESPRELLSQCPATDLDFAVWVPVGA